MLCTEMHTIRAKSLMQQTQVQKWYDIIISLHMQCYTYCWILICSTNLTEDILCISDSLIFMLVNATDRQFFPTFPLPNCPTWKDSLSKSENDFIFTKQRNFKWPRGLHEVFTAPRWLGRLLLTDTTWWTGNQFDHMLLWIIVALANYKRLSS